MSWFKRASQQSFSVMINLDVAQKMYLRERNLEITGSGIIPFFLDTTYTPICIFITMASHHAHSPLCTLGHPGQFARLITLPSLAAFTNSPPTAQYWKQKVNVPTNGIWYYTTLPLPFFTYIIRADKRVGDGLSIIVRKWRTARGTHWHLALCFFLFVSDTGSWLSRSFDLWSFAVRVTWHLWQLHGHTYPSRCLPPILHYNTSYSILISCFHSVL